MVLGKKGMFFTLSVILILSLFLASFSLYGEVEDRKAIQKRVDTLNSFLASTDEDLSRQLYISGYRIIFLAQDEILEKVSPINDMDTFFLEVIQTGKVDGVDQEIMTNYLISDITNSVKNDAQIFGADISITNPRVTLSQEDPWNVKVTLIIDLLLEDDSGLAVWDKKDHEIVAYIPITEFQDPLYYLKTGGVFNYENKITISPDSLPLANPAALKSQIDNWYYHANPDAPSFLDRMEGKTTNVRADNMGIESFVNLLKLQEQLEPGNINYAKSMIDHIYFGTDNPSASSVPGVYDSWFKLDSTHKTFYGF